VGTHRPGEDSNFDTHITYDVTHNYSDSPLSNPLILSSNNVMNKIEKLKITLTNLTLMPAQEAMFCGLIEELGDILVSDKARDPGKEGLDVTRRERERLNSQPDIGITGLNHDQTLAQKVQLGHDVCVKRDHVGMDTREAGDGHSPSLAQVSEPQLHNLVKCGSDVVEYASDVVVSDVVRTKALNLLQSKSRGLPDSWEEEVGCVVKYLLKHKDCRDRGERIYDSMAR